MKEKQITAELEKAMISSIEPLETIVV